MATFADLIKVYGESRQAKQARAADRTNVPMATTVHGDVRTSPYGKGVYGLADEGSYFVARNPTIGTGVAGIAAADAADDLETLLFLRNTSADSEGKRIYLDYLRLVPTAAGTNGTTTQYYSWIDTGTSRYTSGGSAITPQNVNMDSSESAPVTCMFGALVTAAASADKRTVGGGSLRLGVIKVIGDIYTFEFGPARGALPTSLVTSGTAQAIVTVRHAPVVLGPGDMFGLEVYAASQTVAASFEFELGFWVR